MCNDDDTIVLTIPLPWNDILQQMLGPCPCSVHSLAMAETAVACMSSEFVQTRSVPEIVNFALGQPGAAIIPKSLIDETFVIVTKKIMLAY